MVNHFKCICLLLISLWAWHSHADSITATATVDRQTITIDDSLTLTVRINDVGTYKTPNLSALEKDFQIAGTSQSSRRSLINGRSNSTTEWVISLYPKKDGLLMIPPIIINDAKTDPIAIQVNKAFALPAGQLDIAFIENSLSHSEAYVQQQILLNVSIYHSIQLEDMNISDLSLDGATIKKVGQNSFYRTVKGIRHRVHEINYAIFPDKPGELIIPEQTFTARELGQGRSFLSGGKLLRRKSEAHRITVKPVPNNYQDDNWLAAENLSLQETWSSDPENIRAGDSITRSITIKANGVTAAQLPPINFERVKGIKLYPDKPETNNNETATGIIATRIDSTALIATRPGAITLPAITVHWWDVQSNQQKTASIPAKTLNIQASLDTEQRTNQAIDHSSNHSSNNGSNNDSAITATDENKEVITVVNPFWTITALILLALWLITVLAYWRLNQKFKQLMQPNNESTTPKPSEKKAFEALQKACRSQDSQQLRKALINWGKCHWPQHNIQSLDDIANNSGDIQLKNLLEHFNNKQYGKTPDSSDCNPESILTLIKAIRSNKDENKEISTPLPELYRA